MATILGSVTRRRRRKNTAPETTVSGRELCRRMVEYPKTTAADPDTQRRAVPDWVQDKDKALFHAFCVAYDILGSSYFPEACLYWDGSG